MSKMAFLSLILILLSLLCNLSRSTVQILTLHDSSPQTLQTLSHSGADIAVYVSNTHLNEVSTSVLNAEKWLKTHILTYYPSTKITNIVVGHNVLCNQTLIHMAKYILPAMENLQYSLIKWGLQKKIEISPLISSNCLISNPIYLQNVIKPLLSFLQNTNYSYSINTSPTENALFSVLSHTEWVKKLGFSKLGKIRLLKIRETYSKPINFRRLSQKGIDPFPPRPTPMSPAHSPVSYSVPFGPHITLPPLVGTGLAPETPYLPPCRPSPSPSFSPISPSRGSITWQMWCVAKPSVPAETLQEAMDYACGEGGADCGAIGPSGSCHYPDTVVAHASYAFNNYWQKNKDNGGTCAFGGTAMLINADPSYSHCRFILA